MTPLRIWDGFIRFFHWSMVLIVLANGLVLEGGEQPHEWLGYALAGLLLARLIWGFVGSPQARFAGFLPTPGRLRRYLKEFPQGHQPDQGHNPLGALMIFTLLLLLMAVVVSGWMQELDAFWGEEWVQRLHEWAAYGVLGLAALHVLAVLIMQKLTGQALVRAMVTGRRNLPDDSALPRHRPH